MPRKRENVLNKSSVGVVVDNGSRVPHHFLKGSLVVFVECGIVKTDYYVEGEGEDTCPILQYVQPQSVEWFSEL